MSKRQKEASQIVVRTVGLVEAHNCPDVAWVLSAAGSDGERDTMCNTIGVFDGEPGFVWWASTDGVRAHFTRRIASKGVAIGATYRRLPLAQRGRVLLERMENVKLPNVLAVMPKRGGDTPAITVHAGDLFSLVTKVAAIRGGVFDLRFLAAAAQGFDWQFWASQENALAPMGMWDTKDGSPTRMAVIMPKRVT